MKKAILVLGMHRSGTSALSGTLNILGAYLGLHVALPAPDNPKGFFENVQMTALNDTLLMAYGNGWDDENMESIISHRLSQEIIEIVKKTISSIMGDHEIISIKDPRIMILFPYYRQALKELGYKVHLIKTIRNQQGVINSLVNRNNFTEEKSAALLKKYEYEISKHISSKVATIKFEEFVNNPDQGIQLLKDNLPFLDYSEEKISQVKEFLDKSLMHS